MKNIKNLILPIILATSTLVHSIPPSIHLVGKIASYISLPISIMTLMNGITGEKTIYTNRREWFDPITYYGKRYKENGLPMTSFSFAVTPFIQLYRLLSSDRGLLSDQGLHAPDLPITIIGALATAGSIAGIMYCKKQIEAQKQQQSNQI